MDFMQKLEDISREIATAYDLAAFCYDYLIETVGEQHLFLGKYIIENDEAAIFNPNLKKLMRFSKKVEFSLRKQEEEGVGFQDCLRELEFLVKETVGELIAYGEIEQNQAAVPFFILLAIDRYALIKKGRCSGSAPLNHSFCKGSYIYFDIVQNIIDDAALANTFSDVILTSSIRNQMNNLIILEKRDLPKQDMEPPRVAPLWLPESSEKRKIFDKKRLKIAMAPFGDNEKLTFPLSSGSLFHIEYKAEHIRDGQEQAVALLERAIDKKANIIIFPEFVCDQGIQKALQERLSSLYRENPERLKALLLVVAGSGWIENNNVASIYSYNGKLLGRQFKYSSFSDLKEAGKAMIEELENPGKESTIVEIEGLGKILVGLCRDVSERTFTKPLAEVFSPQLLLTPAWSRSINIGFKEQFKEIVAVNHKTCSILCNCCEAIHEKKMRRENGIVVTPHKKGSVIEGRCSRIYRKEGCTAQCEKGGCLFMINMNFGEKAVESGRIVSRIKIE